MMEKYVKFMKECGQVGLTANKAYEVVSYYNNGLARIVDDMGSEILIVTELSSSKCVHLNCSQRWLFCSKEKPATRPQLTREADEILKQMKEITAKDSKSEALIAYFTGSEEMETRSRLAEEYVNKYEQKQEYYDELLKLRSAQIDNLVLDCRELSNERYYWKKSAIALYVIALAEFASIAGLLIYG